MKVSNSETVTNHHFLKAGGETAGLIASIDWSQKSLGPADLWPQSLCTALSLILHSKFPMFLFWGPDFICFYNDAYRPSLGNNGKHPSAMGSPGEEVWPEIWHIIKPLIDRVFNEGIATWSEDELLPIYRNGKIEDVYWTFSYSPVYDENNEVAGVLVTCSETTEKVNLVKKIEANEKKFRDYINASPMPFAIYSGREMRIEMVNDALLKTWDKDHSVIGKTFKAALPELEGQPFFQLLDNVYTTGIPYHADGDRVDLMVNGRMQTFYFNFTYTPLKDDKGNTYGIINTATDITELVLAKRNLEDAEERNRLAVEAGELGTFELDMITGQIFCSPRFYEIFGSKDEITREEGISRILAEDLPIREKAYAEALQHGHLHYEVRIKWNDGSIHWMKMDAKFFFDNAGKPIRLLGTTEDITDEKNTLQKIEESEKHFRNLVQEAPVPKALLYGPDHIIEIANDAVLELWGKDSSIIGMPLIMALPELKNQPYPQILKDVYETGITYKGNERPAYIEAERGFKKVYLNFIFKRLQSYRRTEPDILITGYDVTQQVLSRRKIEESEKALQQANQRLEIALEAGKLGSYELDIATGIIYCTAQFKANYGLNDATDFSFPELLKLIIPAHRDHVLDEFIKAITGKTVYNAEYCITWTDNSLHWIRASGKATYDADGNAKTMIGVTLDITENKMAMQRIEESEQRLNMALEYTNTGSWDLNLQTFNIIYTPRLAEIFGYPPTASITHPQMRQHIHPDDLKPIVEKAFSNAIKTGIYFYEARLIRPDQTTRWIRTQGRIIYDDDKIPVRMLGTIMDITEEKNEQQRKDEFMGIVTHELKTPLTSVKAFAQFLHERALTTEDGTSSVLLKKMVTQVDKLNLLVQDLLDVTRMEGGKMKFYSIQFNFNELVHEITEQIRITTHKHIIIEEGSWNGSIIGDRERTGQVLTNLLTNAIKYSPGADKVLISVSSKDGHVICSVTDFGIGVAKENQQYVFDRFYREPEDQANTFPGLGLGLYISAEIVRRQNGKIWIESEKGEGSVFSFSLPLIN
jgi:PAS domain S-box-containing protein